MRSSTKAEISWDGLFREVEVKRKEASAVLSPKSRAELGQFFTPTCVAQFMASMFQAPKDELRLLDAGGGVGSLTVAFLAAMVHRKNPPRIVHAVLYELDPLLAEILEDVMNSCQRVCRSSRVNLEYDILIEDFVETAASALASPLIQVPLEGFDCAILNPPYRKVSSDSRVRKILSEAGIEVNNHYTAFLALTARLLRNGGELVAITPRSFSNGPYFKAFRHDFFQRMMLRRIHVYESREDAFREDEVLQENIILHAVKTNMRPETVLISSSLGPHCPDPAVREVIYDEIIHPGDADLVVNVIADDASRHAAQLVRQLRCDLPELGLSVSTGRVVDFRAREFLRCSPDSDTVPLIYPFNLDRGRVVWPKAHPKKPTLIVLTTATEELLIPNEAYVLVKRFTAKEERRRLVAALYDPKSIECSSVGFENHLNYFHMNGGGLPLALARGLVAYLNSTLADIYFRNFNGHTQVNAQDLRRLKYPSREQLLKLSDRLGDDVAEQEAVDRAMEDCLELAALVRS